MTQNSTKVSYLETKIYRSFYLLRSNCDYLRTLVWHGLSPRCDGVWAEVVTLVSGRSQMQTTESILRVALRTDHPVKLTITMSERRFHCSHFKENCHRMFTQLSQSHRSVQSQDSDSGRHPRIKSLSKSSVNSQVSLNSAPPSPPTSGWTRSACLSYLLAF